MRVIRSNRMERLVGALAESLRDPSRSPLAPECIVVSSKGMERWLAMELSKHLGVFANATFPFPRTFVQSMFDQVLGEACATELEPYNRDTLTLCIADLLPGLLGEARFQPLVHYLKQGETEVRSFLLAERIASVFDQYLVYRPELLLSWESGKEQDWQAELWRQVVARLGEERHVAARARRFFADWSPLLVNREGLTTRVSVFGASSLPPLFLKVLARLADAIQVDLYWLTPSREYFAELSPRAAVPDAGGKVAPYHPLLVSFGKVGRDFQRLLERDVQYIEPPGDFFEPPLREQETLLTRLQTDLLLCQLRTAQEPAPFAEDGSIVVHSCHSPMREVEVLKDQLLGLLHDDPSLAPGEIAVLTPTIDTYAPLIEAVFGGEGGNPGALPYTIADRAPEAENLAAAGLLGLLRVLDGRMKASEVLDLLQLEPVRARFQIGVADLDMIRAWVAAAGVRWGIDAEHRASHGQPASDRNTWRFGLARMLLGVALPEDDRTLFQGVRPFDGIEGDHALVLGWFSDFAHALFDASREASRALSVERWVSSLTELMERMLKVPESDTWQLSALRDAIQRLRGAALDSGCRRELRLESVRSFLEQQLAEARVTHNFLAGGVTFCALLPMRAIPFRVLVLLGMNDGEFPRSDRSLAFDRINKKPQPGDRSARDEDRYLFLEALLSARERLLITCIGRSVQDNSQVPPSVLVSELLETLELSYGSRRLVVEHPLSSYSPKYFLPDGDPRLFSFGAKEALGARALLSEPNAPERFCDVALPPLSEPELRLEQLIAFFNNPARGFLRDRLAVQLSERMTLIEDSEPLEPDTLERFRLGSWLLERRVRGVRDDRELELFEAGGEPPTGTPGRCLHESLSDHVSELVRVADEWLASELLPAEECVVELDHQRIVGALTGVRRAAQLVVQFSRVSAKHQLGLWLKHLLLCAARPEGYPLISIAVGRPPRHTDSSLSFRLSFAPLSRDAARDALADLSQVYAMGKRYPIPLFPAASLSYVLALQRFKDKSDPAAEALKLARQEFDGQGRGFSEIADPYVQRLYGHSNPLEPRWDPTPGTQGFAELSERVFTPLIQACTSGEDV